MTVSKEAFKFANDAATEAGADIAIKACEEGCSVTEARTLGGIALFTVGLVALRMLNDEHPSAQTSRLSMLAKFNRLWPADDETPPEGKRH